jgi:hypothetical protein
VLTNAAARELLQCGFWAGMDQIGEDALTRGVWSFALDRPALNNKSNCAQMRLSQSDYSWIDDVCTQEFRLACVKNDSWDDWTVSDTKLSWYNGYPNGSNVTHCPSGYRFDVPRTAPQNRKLQLAMSANSVQNVWLKLNDIDSESSWITTWTGQIPNPTNAPGVSLNRKNGNEVKAKKKESMS